VQVECRVGDRPGIRVSDVQVFGRELDPCGVVGVDLREGAEEQTANVRKNGGATSGDAVLGQELIEVVEGMVDALRGLEGLVVMAEMEEMIGGLLFQLFGAMLGTENRTWIGDGEAAAAASRRAVGATNG